MECDLNITKLQGVFHYLSEAVGDLSKIKNKGGNEEKISQIVENVKNYLVLKNILENDKPNLEHNQELTNILALLVINTEFKSDNNLSSITQYSHFVKAISPLSKCVFVSIVIKLGLMECCCSLVLTLLPCSIGAEIFDEFINCSKQCEPPKLLNDSHCILDTIIKMLISLNAESNKQNGDAVDKLGDVSLEILKNVSQINEDWAHKMRQRKVHEHMGHTLFYIFKLLRSCPLNTGSLNRIIQALIDVSIKLLMLVTINVFCTWAEVKYENGQPMQTVIAGEAYMVVEHLQKQKFAKLLIEMLGPMAMKPKTIYQIILESDIETIIANIDKNDENQKLWFRGLINTNLFNNESAMDCLDKWTHLCNKYDVMRLLSFSDHCKEPKVKALVLKCVNVLNIQELEFVAIRHFCDSNGSNLDMGPVDQEILLLLNRTQSGSEVNDEFIKKLYVLLLQNPEVVLSTLYLECLKTDSFVNYLKRAFVSIKTPLEVKEGLTRTTFIKIFKTNPPNMENMLCYKSLLNMLIEINYFNSTAVLNEVFMPRLEALINKNNKKMLLCSLQLLNAISLEYVLHESILEVVADLIKILESNRCTFLNFSYIQQIIVQEVVEFLLKYNTSSDKMQHNLQYQDYLERFEIRNSLNKYYITNMYVNSYDCLLSYVFPQFKFTGTSEDVGVLINILPSCVKSEWTLVIRELDRHYNSYETLLLRLEEMLILLSQMTIQNKNLESMDVLANALKYCVQQYGMVIKDFLKHKYSDVNNEVLLIKSICRILKEVPASFRKTEGLQLICLFSLTALRSLKDDKLFVVSLVRLNDTTISQILAQKMLSTD